MKYSSRICFPGPWDLVGKNTSLINAICILLLAIRHHMADNMSLTDIKSSFQSIIWGWQDHPVGRALVVQG